MGTVTNAAQFAEGGEAPAVSRGGKVYRRFYGTITMSDSYATGGDTVGGLPTGVGTLYALRIIDPFRAAVDSKFTTFTWDGGTSTVKVLAFGEEGTSGVTTQHANTTDISAVSLKVELIYEQ